LRGVEEEKLVDAVDVVAVGAMDWSEGGLVLLNVA
jgi:hypothetical protein